MQTIEHFSPNSEEYETIDDLRKGMTVDDDDLPLKRAKGVKTTDQRLLEDIFENNVYVKDYTKLRSLCVAMYNGEKPMTQAQEREALFKLVPKMAEKAEYPEIDQVPQSRDEPTAGVGPLPANGSTGDAQQALQ